MSNEGNEAIQAVVDRINSYQESATEGTVEKELREGLSESGLEVSDADVKRLVDAIESGEGHFSVSELLG